MASDGGIGGVPGSLLISRRHEAWPFKGCDGNIGSGTGDSGTGSSLNASGLRKGDGTGFCSEDKKGTKGSSGGVWLGVVLSSGDLVGRVNQDCLSRPWDSRHVDHMS